MMLSLVVDETYGLLELVAYINIDNDILLAASLFGMLKKTSSDTMRIIHHYYAYCCIFSFAFCEVRLKSVS
uniref:Uncharacterized protein n=1 Tax=Arundo donax TaxID=35708 RepID=A0A0A9EE15_ARUDO